MVKILQTETVFQIYKNRNLFYYELVSTKMMAESTLNEFLYSTDKKKLAVTYIHDFLKSSYWAKDIPESVVRKSIDKSLCIGVYYNHKQIGFARLVTDYATFAYLADVFVDEKWRGKGVSKGIMKFILSLEFLSGLRRIVLATLDAHALYKQYGFNELERPERYMEIVRKDMYLKHSSLTQLNQQLRK